MKTFLKPFLFLLTLTAFQTVLAKPIEEVCPDIVKRYDNVQIQQQSTREGFCYLSVHPRDSFQSLIYRDYLFSSEGLMMVFNSFSPEEGPGTTGAREFFFFPREFKGYQLEVQGQSLVVKGFNDFEMRFNLKSSQIESISGATVEVKPEVVPENNGGVELLTFNGLYMDAGFTFDNSPSANPNRFSVWKNSQHQVCQIRNTDAFRYKNGEPEFKSQADVTAAIRRKCPEFLIP